jgi:hypothetical protein
MATTAASERNLNDLMAGTFIDEKIRRFGNIPAI